MADQGKRCPKCGGKLVDSGVDWLCGAGEEYRWYECRRCEHLEAVLLRRPKRRKPCQSR